MRAGGRGIRSVLWAASLLLLFQQRSSGQGLKETIEHSPVREAIAGQPLRIEVRIGLPGAEIRFLRVYYRPSGEGRFRFLDLQPLGELHVAELPAEEVTEAGLEYFLLLATVKGDLLTLPAQDAHRSPFVVRIRSERPAAEEEPASLVTVLFPDSGQTLLPSEVFVAVSFTQPDAVDTSRVRLLVDGEDVSSEASISRYVLTWTPSRAIRPGLHLVTLQLSTRSGRFARPLRLGFRVAGEEARPSVRLPEVHGELYSQVYEERVAKRSYEMTAVGGRVRGMAGPANFEADFYITSQETRSQQPRNRLRLAVETRYLGLELGDSYPRFSELTLWGQRVRGVSGRLSLGPFSLQVAHGELARAVEGVGSRSTGVAPAGSYRVVNGDTLIIRKFGTYRRRLMAVRAGVQKGQLYELGLSLVKVRDDTNSIRLGMRPKDNLLIGPDFRLQLLGGKLRLWGALAFSLLTDDISRGPASKAEVDSLFKRSLPFDPESFSYLLIINENTVPLDPRGLTSVAYELQASLRMGRNALRAGYRSVGPDYWCLANPFLRRNLRGLFVDDRLRLFGDQLYLSARFESYEDGFSRWDNLPTNRLRSLSCGLSYFPGSDLPQVSFSIRGHSRRNGLEDTTLVTGGYDPRVHNSTLDASFSLSHNLEAFGRTHRLLYDFSRSLRDDRYGGPLGDLGSAMHLLRWQAQLSQLVQAHAHYTWTRSRAGSGGNIHSFRYSYLSVGSLFRLWTNRLQARLELGRLTSASELRYAESAQSGKVGRTGLTVGGDLLWGQHRASVEAGIAAVGQEESGGRTDRYTDLSFRARYEFRW